MISTDCEITATDNSRHIMISYNESSFDICQKIYQGLQVFTNLLNTAVFNSRQAERKTYVYRRKNEQIYMYLISF